MNNNSTLEQDDFDQLLRWLSADREEAGEKYEQVREGLIRFFRYKGCNDSETLADETINRFAGKVTTLDTSQNFKTITYFYGFAANILLENNRKVGANNVQLDSLEIFQHPNSGFDEDSTDDKFNCLEKCLQELSADEREIMIEYYSKDKLAKIQARKLLAERLKCDLNALQVKTFRLRNTLGKCVRKCMKNSL